MYAPEIVESSLQALHDHPGLAPIFAESLPGGRLTPIPVAECHERRAELDLLWDRDRGEPTRPLSQDEQAFVANETMLAKIDYAYAAERYIFINYEGQSLQPMYPLWESQRLMLALIAERELDHFRSGHPDGLLFNILKGRQLGASTLVQSLLAHRVLTHEQVRTLIASDVPQNSGSEGLFGMLELVVEHWPWWLKPREKFHTKNQHIMFTNGSRVVVESGKSMKGGLQDDGQTKGQIGRSKTYSAVHLSEIATWERPDQINTSLLPAVPRTPRTLMGRESTAQGRNNYWHQEWNLAAAGEDPRFFNIFIPWYAEQSKYWLPTPTDWVPQDFTLAFARRAAEYGPRYMRRTVSLTREQLYWYELHYHAALKMDRLYAFLSEYPSEPEEAFQNSGRSIFSLDTLQRLAAQARPMVDLWTIRPRADLLADKELLRAEYQRSQVETLRSIADLQERHNDMINVSPDIATPVTLEVPSTTTIEPPHETPRMITLPEQRPAYAIPPGYGFHRLGVAELKERSGSEALFNTLQIWQLPRKGHRYIIGVDVADGIGVDRSVCDVVRMATVEEPEEQVAQFISDEVGPAALASVIDAIGHLYLWPDGREAMAAIECNNHGLSCQDTLQLHMGYRHFYTWEVLDQSDPTKRWTTKIGWVTTPKTRPILLDQFHGGVTAIDPITNFSECRVNSPFTLDEMRDFKTDGALWEAEAARGAHDDCIIALAIAHYVAWRLMGGESEPLADRRRRRQEEELRRKRLAHLHGSGGGPVDYRNTDLTAHQQATQEGMTPDERLNATADDADSLFYDPDSRGYAGTLY